MNSISISGNIGKDCEIRCLNDGTQVVSFSVADSKGKDQGAIWWNCSMFGKRAEALQQYLVKGQTVTVIGTVSEREWTDKEGGKRKSMDVRVSDIALQGVRKEHGYQPAQKSAPSTRSAPAGASTGSGFDDMDSDVPF